MQGAVGRDGEDGVRGILIEPSVPGHRLASMWTPHKPSLWTVYLQRPRMA